MTFEQALKWLAKRQPDRFWIYRETDSGREETYFRFGKPTAPGQLREIDDGIERFTQDDIDEILAEIGWAYELRWNPFIGKWRFVVWHPGQTETEKIWFGTKLEAAKAALVAVVKKEKGEC